MTQMTGEYLGLNDAEVARSREQYGINVITPAVKAPWWKLYLAKFEDPVIRILIIAAVLSFIVGVRDGHYAESVGIVIAVLLATGLAYYNEHRAEGEFDVLVKTNDDTPVKVRRNGQFVTVPKRDIVVGDLISLSQGEEIPADGTLLTAVSLEVNESMFTGEKSAVKFPPGTGGSADAEAAYAAEALLRGSMVIDGHGQYQVMQVGDKTQMGEINLEVRMEDDNDSPLNQQLEKLSKWIGVIGFGIAAVTFFALVVRGSITGTLALSASEWLVASVLGVAVAVMLIPIWVPLFYDFFELTGNEKEPPGWMEDGGKTWLRAIGGGLIIGVVGLVILIAMKQIGSQPATWLTPPVISSFLNFFMIAVTIIVVAVPEGLAMSVTLSLAYSMRKMTAANCLVRKMNACETIGAATHICSDKTGTLTQNEMKVQTLAFGETAAVVDKTSPPSALLVESIAANSLVHLGKKEDGTIAILGNPTEGGLALYLMDHGHSAHELRETMQTVAQLPFSTERKLMATVIQTPNGLRLHVKGAPEILLNYTVSQQNPEGIIAPLNNTTAILNALQSAQERGMRTIAMAYRDLPDATIGKDAVLAEVRDLTWIGFAALEDPIRPDVPDAVSRCINAGIHVKIVTGDSPVTAKEIGRQIGLFPDGIKDGDVLLGEDFAALSDEEAGKVVHTIKVLARAKPGHKMRMVNLLEEQGAVVAVTGDGTNDAPALNAARVGLAMGKSGSAVAKEASDIIILDDSFSSIATAVRWGRSLYSNIQKFILFQLTINVAACGIALVGPFIGVDLPLTVIQMLWINLIMDTFAALALATEPSDPAVMNNKPRKSDDFIVTPPMAKAIFGVGLLFLVLFIIMLKFPIPGVTQAQQLTVFFTVFVMLQFWNQFNAKTLGSNKSAFDNLSENPLFLIIAMAIFVGQILIVTFGGDVFRVVPLDLMMWLKIIAATSLVLWIGEISRWISRMNSGSKGAGAAVPQPAVANA